jgi:hypothetical protein
MPHSVTLTTPVPTLEETFEHYGLSKADRRFVTGLFNGKNTQRPATLATRARSGSMRVTMFEAKKASGRAKKMRSRAR